MKTVEFNSEPGWHDGHFNFGYLCNEKGDKSGTYVLASEANERIKVLEDALSLIAKCKEGYVLHYDGLEGGVIAIGDIARIALEVNRTKNELNELRTRHAALVELAWEVVRISDRKHDAWDKLKAALAEVKE